MANNTSKPTDLQLGEQNGVDRSLFFRWTWNRGQTDHYDVWWEYTTGNKITIKKKKVDVWFTGSEDNVKPEVGISIYTYPSNAKKVRVRVRPVAKTNDQNKAYWTCDYSATKTYVVPTNPAGITGTPLTIGVVGLEVIREVSSPYNVRAFWKWTKAYTDYFRVTWYYSDGTKKDKKNTLWFVGSIDDVEYTGGDGYQSGFSAPENSIAVICRVWPFSKIKEETDTLIRYHWRAKYRQVQYNNFPSVAKPANANKPTNVKLHIQNGTDRTYYATWDWTQSSTEGYEVAWSYSTATTSNQTPFYYEGSRGTVSGRQSTYTMPENATKVRVAILPKCKARADGSIAWTAKWSDYVYSPFTILGEKDAYVTSVQIRQERGSESTLVANWTWEKASTTDHYEVEWLYTTGQEKFLPDGKSKTRIFFPGSTSSVTTTQSTYTPPANATSAHIKILPIAKASQWIAKKTRAIEYKIPMAATIGIEQVADADGIVLHDIERQIGTARTVVASWDWDKENTTDHFEVDWRYWVATTGDTGGFWVKETVKNTSDGTVRNDLYTPPDTSNKVLVKVRPIAKTRKVQGVDTPHWTAKYSDYKGYELSAGSEAEAMDPPTPQTPSVFINGTTLTASVNIYDVGADIIAFEVVKDDSTSFNVSYAKVIYNHAEVRVDVAIGGEYKVRAQVLRPIGSTTVDAVVSNPTTTNSVRGAWSEFSENVGTIPATPEQIISHTVQSSENVYLRWSEVLNITGYTIEYALSAEYFDASSQTTSISTGTNPWYIIDGLESGNTYYVRVRAVNDNGESGWTPIYSFILGTRPSAPTTWSDTTKGMIGEDLYLYWTHNSEDKSSQQQAEIELTINGTTTTIVPTIHSDSNVPSYYIFNSVHPILEPSSDDEGEPISGPDTDPLQFSTNTSYAEGSVLLWKVRTRGILDEWSPWSTQRAITLYEMPSLSLYVGNNPDHTGKTYEITHYPLYIYADAFPKNQKAIGYVVDIIANESYESFDKYGNSISIRDQQSVFEQYYTAESNELDITLTAGDVNLDDGITYTLSVTVAMDSGLSGSNNWTFAARWDSADLVPNAEVTINKRELSAYIRPFCMDTSGGYIENVLLSVYRIEYDGRYVAISENLPNGEATVVDPHPSLNYARYRIVSMDEDTGETSFYDVPGIFVGETAIVIQWNEAWKTFDTNNGSVEGAFADPVYTGSTLKLPYNVEISDNTDIDVALNEYIGRAHPVSYYGTQLGIKGSWNAVIPRDDIETLYALRRLAIYRGDVYVREPSGVGYWANINVSFSKRYSEMTIPVSLNVTRVEGGI